MDLKSTDYAKLIQFAALKFHNTALNRTQINKILFFVYGKYLAETGEVLFEDDTPKAWPFGPVFPIVNKRIDVDDIPRGFSDEKNEAYRNNMTALGIVRKAVDMLYNKTAYELTKWSHRPDSPWYETLFPANQKRLPWNTEIKKELIASYFKENPNG